MGPVQTVTTTPACLRLGPDQTVTTTRNRRPGGATSTRHGGADSGCHGQATNQHVADELSLSLDAVKTHLRTLFRKLAIEHLPQNQKRARLAEMALQYGLVSTREL